VNAGDRGGEPPADLEIREMTADDWPAVAEIYEEGIATGDATLDARVPSWPEFDRAHRPDGRLVATLRDRVVGWFALTPWSSRDVYRGVAWESIYVAAGARGRGVGRRLLQAAIGTSERLGVWTLLAGVEAENVASLALHEGAGFRRIGVQERVGRDPTGRWRDVILLERRSASIGSDAG
jgi:L-amino acid N-acyltransferase YncA